ncbi:hypothetical protein G5B31_15645 [Rhodobacter sp. SGA-6-6]|uniref:hypothetical protein n=1 Tax=Rhodobacter sp. SGA-6-6 TaxID=2710882 RepID=UPI0013E9B94E|nr:hypothetical protein [Rhodobacter sp. SGA-6-6]NGM46971.1 hypothetical protein [Rhodobacter sp. SGA-6-6]
MKKALVLAVGLSLSASVVSAGGPIIIEDDAPVEVVTTEKPRSGALLPLIAGLVVLGALASSGNGSGSGS